MSSHTALSSLLSQARAALVRGESARALDLAQQACVLQPDSTDALALLGNAAIALGRTDIAVAALTRLHRLQPRHTGVARSLAGLLNQRGSQLRREGHESAALDAFRQAIALQPGHALAEFNAALTLHALHHHADALAQLQLHLEHHPDDAEARLLACQWRLPLAPQRAAAELGALLASPLADRLDAAQVARTAARAGLATAALTALERIDAERSLSVAISVSDALRERGDIPAALDAGHVGFVASTHGARSPGLRARLAALSLSPMMRSVEAIASDRARLRAVLDELEAEWTPAYLARCEPALEQLAWSNFHLAYHGENDRELQQRHARLIERAAAAFVPSLAEAPSARGGSRRIGLLSSCWRDCTVGAYFGGWIDWLREAGYDVHLYQLGPRRDAVTERLAARATAFHFHAGPLLALAETIRADALDLLIYPELGMDARLLPLAALRLARRQAVAWGHPVTTGFSTFDGNFTCAEMEPVDAGEHYVEPLLPLPGLGVDYSRPEAPQPNTRSGLGLPSEGTLVLVPQSLFKLHPDDDELLADVAARAPHARFVLFEGEHEVWRSQYLARLAPVFAARGLDPATRLHWMALGSRTRFLQINRACDLMLDSLRWSGGNTSLDALVSGLPLVSCPGAIMRARQSLAMLRRLELEPDLVCDRADALALRAAELLREPDRLRPLASAIGARLDALFTPRAARETFLAHIDTLCGLS